MHAHQHGREKSFCERQKLGRHTRVQDLDIGVHTCIPALGSWDLVPQCSRRVALTKENQNGTNRSKDRETNTPMEEPSSPQDTVLDPQDEERGRYLAQSDD